MFIDFLHIKERDFSKEKLIVFYGVSGGGKSTYLDFFMKKFPDNIFLFHKDQKIKYIFTEKKNIFIDEIVYFRQLFIIVRYLLSGKKVFVATHIHCIFYTIFFLFFKKKLFTTEKSSEKIMKYLETKQIIHDKKSIQYFMNTYKGSFTDIDMILSFYPEKDKFSEILELFERECKIERRMNY